ncbi:MAG: hypothetical protein LBG27_10065 [Spirochaetaceae bacterium]|nr:hypothetical protein [Spirochaetaceae bacterium]
MGGVWHGGFTRPRDPVRPLQLERRVLSGGWAGVPRSAWQEWLGRKGEETKHNGNLPKRHWLTPLEREAVITCCRERLEQGCRRLAHLMTDENIAAASCSAVYNVLRRAGLSKKRAISAEESKKGFGRPRSVHEQWHTDFSSARQRRLGIPEGGAGPL